MGVGPCAGLKLLSFMFLPYGNDTFLEYITIFILALETREKRWNLISLYKYVYIFIMRTCGDISVLIIIKWNLEKRRGHFCRLGYKVLSSNNDQLSSEVGL